MTNNVKIGIDADFSKAAAQADNFAKTAGRKVSEGLNPGKSQIDAELQKAEQLSRKLKQIAEEYRRTFGRGITGAQAGAVNAAYDRYSKSGSAHSVYTRQFSGADEWFRGYGGLFNGRAEAQRHFDRIAPMLRRATGEDPTNGPAGFRASPWWSGSGQRMSSMAGAAGGALGSIMTGGGDGGMVSAAGSVGGGMLGMIAGAVTRSPVVGAVTGAFGSNLGGSIGGKIDSALQGAIQNAIETSRLRYSMGELNNAFTDLETKARASADSMGLMDAEAIRMGRQFAAASGRPGANLFEDVTTSGRYARELGMSTSSATGFFGAMRGFGATAANDTGSRRMGYIIGEAIGKSGAFAKSEELLTSVSSFVIGSARSSLLSQSGTVSGYADMLSTAVRRSPFADVAGFGNLISGADAAFRAGGGSGEASANFRLGAYQKAMGRNFSGMDVSLLNESGLFATPAEVFGKDSPAYQAADAATRARYQGYAKGSGFKSRNIDILMQQIESQYGGDSTMMRQAIAGELFGGNNSHATAFYGAWKAGGSKGIGSDLRRIVGQELSPEAVMAAAPFLYGTKTDIAAQAKVLKSGRGFSNALTSSESASLDTTNPDALKQAVIKLTATRIWDTDKGRDVETSVNQVETAITRMSDKLIPLTQDIRDTVIDIMGRFQDEGGGTSAGDVSGIRDAMGGRKKRLAELDAHAAEIAQLRGENTMDTNAWGTPIARPKTALERIADRKKADEMEAADAAERARLMDEQAADEKRMSSMSASMPKGVAAYSGLIAKAQSRYPRLPMGLISSIMSAESGGNPGALSPKGASGLMQMMPATAARFGVTDRTDPEQSIMGGSAYLDWLYKHFDGDLTKTIAAYNSGEGNVERYHGVPPFAETQDYVRKVRGYMAGSLDKSQAPGGRIGHSILPTASSDLPPLLDPTSAYTSDAHEHPLYKWLSAKLPPDHRNDSSGGGSVNFKGEFILRDAQGNQRADPIIKTGAAPPSLRR